MNISRTIVVLVALLLPTLAAQGHDTDIYINQNNAGNSVPLVMFSLDLRPNTGSSACTTAGGTDDPCNFLRVEMNGKGPYLPQTGAVSRFELYKAVLRYVLDRTSGIKVGLMVNHNHENNCAGPQSTKKCSNGGYILSGFVPVNDRGSAADPTTFEGKLVALSEPSTGSQAHTYQGRELFFEFYRYLTGKAVYNGHNGWTDYGTNNSTNLPDENGGIRSWDPNAESSGVYDSPLRTASECTKIYTVNVLFSVSQQDADSNDEMRKSKANGGLGVDIDAVAPHNQYTEDFARMVRWLYETDLADGTFSPVPNLDGKQNVTSYFITAADHTKERQYASAGQGLTTGARPYTMSGDPKALADALTNIFQQILSVSTTFTSPSVAVNVYNRSQVLSDVYIAMFQAQEEGRPLWAGNLKKYAMSGNVLVDVNNANAVAGDGRVRYDALSYWTDASTLPPPDASIGEIAGKDGRSVARGGCGQRIPGFVSGTPGLENPSGATSLTSTRKIFTEPASGSTLRPLNANPATAAALFSPVNYFGATTIGDCTDTDPDPNSACNLIKFARGLGDDNATKRDWLVADPLHSKPLAINYGAINGHSESNPDIRIMMGTNDGLMRMIRNTSSSGAHQGIESWAFMPLEAMATLPTLKANAIPVDNSTPQHPVTVDGSPAVYIYDADEDGNIEAGDKVHVYFGMRRGGYSYYALDVSNPDDPRFLWKITKGGPGTDFAELGQTWSTPRVARMLIDGSTTPRTVLIFGGGYNEAKDTHPPHVANRTVPSATHVDADGNAVFIVDAFTGELLWKAVYTNDSASAGFDGSKTYRHTELKDSIPSDVTPVDSDGNGLVDRVYVGDTGGRLWRIDMKCIVPSGISIDANGDPLPGCGDAAEPKPWTITPILSAGRHFSATLENDRRFFYAPDYVQTVDSNGNAFDAILIGSGDREDPLQTDTINYFYMVRDSYITTGSLPDTFTAASHNQLGDVTDCTPATPCNTPPDLTYGWRLKLENCVENDRIIVGVCGEKTLAPAVTLGGAVLFTTYIPKGGTSVCELSEGRGLIYAVGVQSGEPVGLTDSSGNLLGKEDRYSLLLSGGIPSEVVLLGGGEYLRPDLIQGQRSMPAGMKTYWYKELRK